MNGTTLRIASAAACALALAAPAGALAKSRHHVHRAAAVPTPTVVVPHDYLAGGNGASLETFGPGQVNLFDPLQLAQSLGNQALGDLGLPPVVLPQI
jgi:hypothetical protein